MAREDAETAVRRGDIEAALRHLQDEIRRVPANADLRVFLFQLLCVQGQWERALTQLNVAADLDARTLAMAQMYREAIRCEALRHEVFAGRTSPVVFGQPEEWVALLVEALQSEPDRARTLRDRAFELAPMTAGTIDGQPFAWIADADMRLGPVCEAVVQGQYYWVPFARLARVELDEPADLRDVVWMPARLTFVNGGETVAVVPTRYPDSHHADDPQVRLGRKTTWLEASPDVFTGLGQRVLTTDAGEHAVMDVRVITLGEAATAAPADAVADA